MLHCSTEPSITFRVCGIIIVHGRSMSESCGFCGYQLQVFSPRQLWYWVHVPMNKNFLSIHESYPQKKIENHHPDTFITTQEHWLLWNGMIPLHEKIHFIFSMTEIKCKLVKFNKCYVKRILLFIVIDLNRKKWWSIDEVSTVWLELFTCSYSCTVEITILSTIWK